MAEINLLKSEFKGSEGFNKKRRLVSLYVVVGILVLEVGIFVWLAVSQNSLKNKISEAKREAAEVEFQVEGVSEERLEAVSFQERLANLNVLLANHIFWSPVFDELERFTLKGALYKTVQVTQSDKVLTITGVIPSYTDLGKLIRGLELSPGVNDVKLKASSQNEEGELGYSFNIELSFSGDLLEKEF